jgi:hypothetical protein
MITSVSRNHAFRQFFAILWEDPERGQAAPAATIHRIESNRIESNGMIRGGSPLVVRQAIQPRDQSCFVKLPEG